MNMTKQQLVTRALNYSAKGLGERKAYQVFKGAAPELEGISNKTYALGEILGYKRIKIDHEQVRQDAKKEMGEDYKGAVAPYPVIYKHLLKALQVVALNPALGINPADLTPENLFGKNANGWVKVPGSAEFDLGENQWRVTDFLGPNVTQLGTVNLSSFTFLKDKNALGDGVVMVVKPEFLGLEPGLADFFQGRILVRDAYGVIKRVYKGLSIIHPDAENVLAYTDGYGHDLTEGSVEIYNMTWGSAYIPKSRYNPQGFWAQGVKDWYRPAFTLDNLRLACQDGAGDEYALAEDKLIAANAPVSALGGFGIISSMTRLGKLSVHAGKSRMILPAIAFKYISSLKHVAEIESISATLHANQDKLIPFYYAPQSEARYYKAFRKGNSTIQRVLNRRPDVHDGQCTRRFELKGFTGLEAFVIPSWGLRLAGADFDGDAAVDMPVPEQGGLYRAFNDLPEWLFNFTLAMAKTDDRKVITLEDGTVISLKSLRYESTLHRWAGQLEAAVALGVADITGRKFVDRAGESIIHTLIDMGERIDFEGKNPALVINLLKQELTESQYRALGLTLKAWSMIAWVQCSVDRQKRPIPWVHPGGTTFMPDCKGQKDELFMTDLLRMITKGDEAGDEAATSYDKAWHKFSARLQGIRELYTVLCTSELQGASIVSPSPELTQSVKKWAGEIYTRFDSLLKDVPMQNERPLPFAGKFPKRAAVKNTRAEISNLALALEALDTHWDSLNDVKGAARAGIYNLKQGLLEAARELGVDHELAESCTSYGLFKEFASVEQLEAYFKSIPGARIGDYFSVLTEKDFSFVDGAYENTQRVTVGFSTFKPGELKVMPKLKTATVFVKQQDVQAIYTFNTCTLSDTLIALRGVLWDKGVSEAPALSQRVAQAAPMVTDASSLLQALQAQLSAEPAIEVPMSTNDLAREEMLNALLSVASY